MPPAGGEAGVAARERLADRHGVQDDEPVDGSRVIESGAKGDVGAAIVTDDGEAVVTECLHQRDTVARHRPLRVRLVIRRRRRLGRLAVPARIGTDDEVRSGEERRDEVPRRMGARVTVQQEYRRPGTAVTDAQRRLPHVREFEREAFEHGAQA